MSVHRARMDAFVGGLTVSVLIVLTWLMVMSARAAIQRPGATATLGLGAMSLAAFGITGFAYAYAPRAFCVDGESCIIVRPAGNVVIPLESIVSVRPLDAFVGLSLKAPPGGNSGLFGIYGTFYRKDIGKYRMYGRAATGTVLMETLTESIVVAPERRDAFVAILRKSIAHRDRDAMRGENG